MSLRNASPLKFSPRGLSDALDGSEVFSGAMASLQNLIPDPSTRSLWQCRPAGASRTTFGGFSSPGFISCLKIIGNIAYGMIATSRFAGNDEPFAYNLSNNTFLTISGVLAANTPISPASSGAWVPPTMDLVGTNVLVTHPGFTGSGGVFFGWFDISNPAAISWNGGNLTGLVTFTTPPSSVKNFNGRAYWITNPPAGQPALIFSDVLVPRNVTNANQILTFDDNVPLTALGALPLNNQLGGIIQALIGFKGVQNMSQVTGDAASTSNPLSKNALNVATGTISPNSIASTAKGLAFVAPDGLRMIDFNANVSDPTGVDGMGKTLPFIYSLAPSRICAAANGSVYRVTTQDGSLVGSPFAEYWYDFTRQIWSGPHTFPASLIASWVNTFIMAPNGVTGSLWQSDYVQSSTSSFTENGVALTFNWTSCMLPDTNQMAEYAMVQSTIYMGQNPGATYNVFALDQNGSVLQSAPLVNTQSATVWGGFQWGHALWGGGASNLFPQAVPWTQPVVFRRMQISLQGPSSLAVKVGTMHLRYQQLGYLQQTQAA